MKLLNAALEKAATHHVIADSVPFLLAKYIELPDSFAAFRHGHLKLRFHDFACHGLADAHASTRRGSREAHVDIRIPSLSFDGAYTIEAAYAPIPQLDLGGTMMPRVDSAEAAGADEGTEETPYLPKQERDEYLDAARAERARLLETTNGQQLINTFNQHDETYNSLFEHDANLRFYWERGGATRQMSAHTARAIKSTTGDVVNPDDQLFGKTGYENSYNGHAFIQQNNVIASCLGPKAGGYNPWSGGDIPDNKYTRAALAALNFQGAVSVTGNTDKAIKPMTGAEVHATVRDHKDPLPEVGLQELKNRVDQGIGAAGAAALAAERGWVVLDEAEQARMHDMIVALWDRAADPGPDTAHVLWTGSFLSRIRDVAAMVALRQAEGAWALDQLDVVLPAFELEIDDSAWTGAAGEIARERIARNHFFRHLLLRKLQRHLRDVLDRAVHDAWLATGSSLP